MLPFDIWEEPFNTLRNIRERQEREAENKCDTCKGEGTIKVFQHSPLIPPEETTCPTCRGSGTKIPK